VQRTRPARDEVPVAAVRRRDGGLVTLPGPIDLQVDLAAPGQADRESVAPLLARRGPTTLQVRAADAVAAYRWVRVVVALAAQRDEVCSARPCLQAGLR
jgi:D-aminopeptidase